MGQFPGVGEPSPRPTGGLVTLPTIVSAARTARGALAGMSTYRWLQVAVLVILVVAFITSFESGASGAAMLGYPEQFKRAFPLVVDVVAAVATIAHGRAPTPQLRRLAVVFVLVPMTLSWGANALDHWTRALPQLPAGWPIQLWAAAVVLVAGVCPVAVAALLYFMGRYSDADRTTSRPAEPAVGAPAGKSERAQPDAAPAPVAPVAPPPATRQTNGASRPIPSADVYDAAHWAAAEIRAGRDGGRDSIRQQFGLSEWKARQAASLAKETVAEEQPAPVGES